ncbi:MAG TPA: hypothetical protein DFR83_22335, partial [Deltaproteobacteria bacterium]|nr:hypothetical protein [Deltaproteobacteria bacterium]
MQCEFCGEPSLTGRYDRVAGLDVCATCRSTGVLKHLRARGYEAAARNWTTRDPETNNRTFHVQTDITLPVDSGLTLRCVKERWYHHISRLFRSELEVGDPIFDDHIYVAEGTSAAVADLLSHEGIQSAILLVGAGGSFVLEGPTLVAHSQSRVGLSAEEIRGQIQEVA